MRQKRRTGAMDERGTQAWRSVLDHFDGCACRTGTRGCETARALLKAAPREARTPRG
ncbi:hypothetical protein [Streptomyces palmae]|uniref:hypothetical protein n=1 Tax=Streptomyces palmae TaxID=1701085 RepID=UPI001432D061|nr:hypothetical protein [Streptomyces palmae]